MMIAFFKSIIFGQHRQTMLADTLNGVEIVSSGLRHSRAVSAIVFRDEASAGRRPLTRSALDTRLSRGSRCSEGGRL